MHIFNFLSTKWFRLWLKINFLKITKMCCGHNHPRGSNRRSSFHCEVPTTQSCYGKICRLFTNPNPPQIPYYTLLYWEHVALQQSKCWSLSRTSDNAAAGLYRFGILVHYIYRYHRHLWHNTLMPIGQFVQIIFK